jgi:16S rRNA processing protein RimM
MSGGQLIERQVMELGEVGAPFGVRGWTRVRSFTDPPAALLGHRVVELRVGGGWQRYRIEASGRSGEQLTVKFEGVADRNAAAMLRGARIGIERGLLPPPGPREFYRADLVGLEVWSLGGSRLGSLEHFVETPAHAVMVVRGEREHWIPALPRYLRRVELEQGRVLVDWDEVED